MMRRHQALVALSGAASLAAAAPRLVFAQAAPATIRLITSPSDDTIPLLYGQSAGLFRQAGLTIDIVRASSGAAVAQAVVGGAVEVGKSSIGPLIAAYARGVPVVLVAPTALHRKGTSTNSAILVAANSPIRTPLELQGKVMSCTAIGDIGYLATRSMIDAQGGDSSTIKWVEIPTSASALAIEQGRVEAGITVEPFMTKEVATGKVRVLFDVLDGYAKPILEGAYFAMRDYVNTHRDEVGRFAGVLRQAAIYTNAHTAEVLPLFVSASGMDPELAAKMHHALIATSFDPAEVQPVIDAAAKYKAIPKAFDAREIIATTSS